MEMLVVIAILGILMAMMVPAAGLIIKRAKIAQAKSDAGVVVTVLQKYFAEYNRWPGFYHNAQENPTDSPWVAVMSPMPAVTNSPYNPKRIVFFEPSGGALSGDGSTDPGAWVDPWGKPFEYRIDEDRDGSIDHPNAEGAVIRAQAIAWSAGPDGIHETWEDNVTSWE